MRGLTNPDFAARCLGVMLLMLRDHYTDTEIKFILKRKNVEGALKVLDKPDTTHPTDSGQGESK